MAAQAIWTGLTARAKAASALAVEMVQALIGQSASLRPIAGTRGLGMSQAWCEISRRLAGRQKISRIWEAMRWAT